MKLWILLGLTLFIFSGCSTKTQNHRLRVMNAKQASIIRQQQSQINALRAKLTIRQNLQQKTYQQKLEKKILPVSQGRIPKAPKKNIVLKKVEDSNYSSAYMYPGSKKPNKVQVTHTKSPKKLQKSSQTVSSIGMTKTECIAMIGQAKFDKYTQMFGNEAASLKRCKMLKAMK